MKYTSTLIVVVLITISLHIAPCESRGDEEISTRDSSFTDVGSSKFDELSAPTFISAADWNNDGYVDLLFNGNRLFRNNGPPIWDFTRMRDVFGSSTSGSRNGVWADWDGDGDQDLYQGCGKGTGDRFWENQGGPDYILEDISGEVFGYWLNTGPNTGNAWGDYDLDGDLDIYVGNGEDWNDGNPINYPDFFLRNDGGDRFMDVSSTVGIETGEDFYSRGVTWGDFNNDALLDPYVSHYRIRENHLFTNQGDGSFVEEGRERNCSGTYDTTWYYDQTQGRYYGPMWGHTIGSSWADFNRDGDLDLWTSDFVHKYVGPYGGSYDIRGYICDDGNLYINDGAPYYNFVDYRNTSGIPIWPIGGQGVYQGDQTFSGITVGDYDNDGWEDMYIPQVYGNLPYTTPHLFHNKGPVSDNSIEDGTTFEDVTDSLGIKGANTYACLFLDYDNDGDLDLLTGGGDTWDGSEWTDYRVRLYRNQGTTGKHWLEVKLNGTGKNKDGVGARVTVRYGDSQDEVMIVREVRAGTGHAHQGSNVLHFGLGDIPSGSPLNVEVKWPDGLIHNQTVYADRIIEITKPTENGPEAQGYDLPSQIGEDTPLKVTVDAQVGDSQITGYIWDLDSDNRFDLRTDLNEINITFHHSGLKHIRCRVIDGNYLARDIYPIIIDVPNKKPLINLKGRTVEMDSQLILPDDLITDSPSDLANISWIIDWGDGNIDDGTGPSWPSHIYTEPGSFALSVEASDEISSVSDLVEIEVLNVDPWGYIQLADGNQTVYYEDEMVELQPIVFDTESDTGDMSIKWDYGDGVVQDYWSDLDSFFHSYEKNGIYNPKAYVKDQYGGVGILEGIVNITNQDPEIIPGEAFSPFVTADEDEYLEMDDIFKATDTRSDLETLEFRWDFDDGNLSGWRSSPDVSHLYEREGVYAARLRVRDDDGSEAEAEIEVRITNVKPVIDSIDVPPDLYEDKEGIIWMEASDTHSDLDRLEYHLDLGDGRVVSGEESITIQYHRSGIYELKAWVTDDDGDSSDMEISQLIVLNFVPSGSISSSFTSLNEDEKIQFEAVDVYDTPTDLANLTFTWDLDDGSSPVKGKKINHTFTERGSYNIKLIISDGDVETRETTRINVKNPPPVAILDVSGDTVMEGENITFSAFDSYDNPSDNSSLEFYWDFDDGTTGEGAQISHSFSLPGEYKVILEVMDDDGSFSTDQINITVLESEDTSQGDEDGSDLNILLWMMILIFILLFIVVGVLAVVVIIRRGKSDMEPDKRGGPPGSMNTGGIPPAIGDTRPPGLPPPANKGPGDP